MARITPQAMATIAPPDKTALLGVLDSLMLELSVQPAPQ